MCNRIARPWRAIVHLPGPLRRAVCGREPPPALLSNLPERITCPDCLHEKNRTHASTSAGPA